MRTIKTYSKRAPFYNAFLRSWISVPARRRVKEYAAPRIRECEPQSKILVDLVVATVIQQSYIGFARPSPGRFSGFLILG
jgi:hypothetical protein